MEAQINIGQRTITVKRPHISINVGGSTPMEVHVEKPTVNITPPHNSVDVQMVCKVLGIGGSGEIPMMTQAEYDALVTKNRQSFYFITDDNGQLTKIYAGYRLIAYSNESGGFTYTFPFVLS